MKRNLFLIIFLSLILTGCLPQLTSNGAKNTTYEFFKGSVVKGFPPLPLYPKARVIESFGNGQLYGASFMTKDDLSKVIKFYGSSLKPSGWDSNLKKRSETNYFFEIKNDKQKGTITVNTASDGKMTAISMSISPR